MSAPGQASDDHARPTEHDLVVMFVSVDYDVPALYAAALEAAVPAQVVGCTAMASLTHEVQLGPGCVAALLDGDESRYGVCHVQRDDADITIGAASLAADLQREVLPLICPATRRPKHARQLGISANRRAQP